MKPLTSYDFFSTAEIIGRWGHVESALHEFSYLFHLLSYGAYEPQH